MWMTFRHPCNHPCSFTVDVLLVCQLLAQDCTQHEHKEDGRRRRLLIPRGVHFSEDLFPHITVPQAHTEPFPDPQLGIVPLVFNVGPLASMDTLFTGAAGDLDLFTAMEISALVRVGFLKPPIASKRDTPATPVEPTSSSGKRDRRDSQSRHCHPVSAAAGSHDDLDRSEHEHEAACKCLQLDIQAKHSQSTSRDVSHGIKCGGTVDVGLSIECPRPKEHRSERGRSRECKCFGTPEHTLPRLFLLPPTAPNCPTTGSVSVPSVDPNRGPPSSDKGSRTGVSVPAGLVPPCNMRQVVQSSGQLLNAPIGSVLITSGLTAVQAEEIFLLTREVQTLWGKLAIDFMELSHSEATFCMGAQATSHENTVDEHPDRSSTEQ